MKHPNELWLPFRATFPGKRCVRQTSASSPSSCSYEKRVSASRLFLLRHAEPAVDHGGVLANHLNLTTLSNHFGGSRAEIVVDIARVMLWNNISNSTTNKNHLTFATSDGMSFCTFNPIKSLDVYPVSLSSLMLTKMIFISLSAKERNAKSTPPFRKNPTPNLPQRNRRQDHQA